MARRIRKAQPTAGDVHVNRPLTQISIAFVQDAAKFIADRVFPNIPVTKRSNVFFSYNRADWLRSQAQERAPGTESAGGGFAITTDSYFCRKFAFHKDVDDDTRANSDDPIQPDRDATAFVTQQMLLKREERWVTSYFITGVWTNETTPATLWDDAMSTPIVDIRTQLQAVESKTGFRPNVGVLSPQVWQVLQDNADFLGRISFGTPGGPSIVTLNLLAQVLELEEILVPRAVRNTAAEGATEATDFVVGKHALFVYRNPTPSVLMPSGGYTFSWTGLLGAGALGNRIKRFRMEEIESDRVEGEMAFDTKIIAAELGHFFLNPVP